MFREKVVELKGSDVSLAQELIRSSAFWIEHIKGIIHPMPGMADRIEQGPHGWQIRLGANKFLVGRAIGLSQKTILYELDRSERLNKPLDAKLLSGRLVTSVRVSVADHADSFYEYYTGGADPEEKAKGFYYKEPYEEEIRNRQCDGFKRIGIIFREVLPPSRDYWKGYMKFGVHAIKVDAFIHKLLELVK